MSKMEDLQTQIVTRTTEVKTYSSELSELKRSSQSLEITRQSLLTEVVKTEAHFLSEESYSFTDTSLAPPCSSSACSRAWRR